MSISPRPLTLVILDGWGYSEETTSNAIQAAHTPVWDTLWNHYPHTVIRASGAEVGLPNEQMGNSEVGHLNLGAGRVVYQEYTRVNRAIRTDSFFTNHTLTEAVDKAVQSDKAVHILGLLSPSGVHSHEEHIHAMVELAVKRHCHQVYLHAFLDGRDTAPKSAQASILAMQAKFTEIGHGRFASLIGRYYGMDRDHRWPRIQAAYNLIAAGQAEYEAENAEQALAMAYERGETDEFVQATRIVPPGKAPVRVEDGDVVIFMNFRSDRARQITRAFIEPNFTGFKRTYWPNLAQFVSLTEYSKDFDIPVAFPSEKPKNTLGQVLAESGLRQLRIAETEKYAHVTFFFNGGREQPFEGEDRILIPSPQVATYDQKPEMSAVEITDSLVEAIESGKYDVIICNYANPDMVGHTGNFNAAVKSIEALDQCLGRVWAALQSAGGELIITADHGNAEKMYDAQSNQPHTAHTHNGVPLIFASKRSAIVSAKGSLADVSPTMLYLIGIEPPPEMSEHRLIELRSA
ncbi:2,3-bisphosphoglycerate-independent phosphoglycerate mutase [Nitrosococcus wardiae]|uniref:2,3-bisphosphoglycerate-independent phosphoglycerate mutase n=1 Tax=Nitrosococcus wardiae TaxID=1814290 RepID=A0A4P7BXA1_9GAMM|nr:2,3-bisphosphoglycerate-independent phosphoglycerate mutase [Nitrosococcus wardiae]QBQ53764.1 2,3-bisphosphoglycerate-independent phosphoglycerate mutase [Nitrosococcus wardiae]